MMILRWLPVAFAVGGVAVTVIFTVCEATGHSLGRFLPLEPIMGASELGGWLIRGDDAATRAELYFYGFPFGAAWNGFVGWLLGLIVRLAFRSLTNA